eukprot:5134469-Prymnesium_polylepis.2
MQLSQLYVSAPDARPESLPRDFRSFISPGEKGSLSQLKTPLLVRKHFRSVNALSQFKPCNPVTFAHYPPRATHAHAQRRACVGSAAVADPGTGTLSVSLRMYRGSKSNAKSAAAAAAAAVTYGPTPLRSKTPIKSPLGTA